MLGSESTDNQTPCTLMSPKRQTCSPGKTENREKEARGVYLGLLSEARPHGK